MSVTELDKTILLAMLVFTKGSLKKYIDEKEITSKFPMRKRKLVRISIDNLIEQNFLIKHIDGKKYKLTKRGRDQASKVLHLGAKLRV